MMQKSYEYVNERFYKVLIPILKKARGVGAYNKFEFGLVTQNGNKKW